MLQDESCEVLDLENYQRSKMETTLFLKSHPGRTQLTLTDQITYKIIFWALNIALAFEHKE